MKHVKDPTYYPPLEEKINVLTHAFGLFLSIIALILLIMKASLSGTDWHIISFSIYGASLIILYAASTFFHNAKNFNTRRRLNIFDHASIYILIAGTYTPFTLVILNGTIGWILFGITWGIALTGIILKLFYTGKYDKVSTIAYVLMGWIIVFAFKPLLDSFSLEGIVWLVLGGIAYTIGAIFYSANKLRFNHAIFHIFVLIGSFCHFISIFFYV